MSNFSTGQRDGEYPIINLEAENEHFAVSDSIIKWLETCKTAPTDTGNNDVSINLSDNQEKPEARPINLGNFDELCKSLPPPSAHHPLSASGMAWSIIKKVTQEYGSAQMDLISAIPHASEIFQDQEIERCKSPDNLVQVFESELVESFKDSPLRLTSDPGSPVRMRGTDEWAPPRAQIIFNIHEESNFRKLMQRQNYRCAGCGTKIDLELARRLVLYCHYLGKYFCKCCFSHKAIHLPGYILQKWDFHKYPISHFALQLLDRIANEPLFNINDINSSLYRKVKKLRHLIDIRMQLYYLKIYVSTCTQTDKLDQEYASFTHQHLLQDDVHLYSLNNLIEIQHGKLYEYLNDLVSRSIAHIAKCDKCRAKGHYCQLCGPSSFMSSMIMSGGGGGIINSEMSSSSSNRDSSQAQKLKHSSSAGQNIYQIGSQWGRKSPLEQQGTSSNSHSRSSSGNYSNFVTTLSTTTTTAITSSTTGSGAPSAQPIPNSSNTNDDHELIFPFEIGRVAQCRVCGCCFHLQCFIDAGQNCPKCERIHRRNAEMRDNSTDTSALETSSTASTTAAAAAIATSS